MVDGKVIRSLKNGRSIFFDEEVQMIPPFMIDGVNSAEVFLSNMNYAQVSAVRLLKWHASWVQNVVRQFGLYLLWAQEF